MNELLPPMEQQTGSLPATLKVGNEPGGELVTNIKYREWLSVAELSQLAGVSERAIQKSAKAGMWRGIH